MFRCAGGTVPQQLGRAGRGRCVDPVVVRRAGGGDGLLPRPAGHVRHGGTSRRDAARVARQQQSPAVVRVTIGTAAR